VAKDIQYVPVTPLRWVSAYTIQIHLHGHDFAILEQKANAVYDPSTPITFNDPPRRDVVFLPAKGYAIIAFKTDNPGAWLLHCHIAGHASAGLDMQILEDREAANVIWKPGNSKALTVAAELCSQWTSWCSSTQPEGTCNTTTFQDDSGI
jgi:multicopper oxidase